MSILPVTTTTLMKGLIFNVIRRLKTYPVPTHDPQWENIP
jgi:hypothetical protein